MVALAVRRNLDDTVIASSSSPDSTHKRERERERAASSPKPEPASTRSGPSPPLGPLHDAIGSFLCCFYCFFFGFGGRSEQQQQQQQQLGRFRSVRSSGRRRFGVRRVRVRDGEHGRQFCQCREGRLVKLRSAAAAATRED